MPSCKPEVSIKWGSQITAGLFSSPKINSLSPLQNQNFQNGILKKSVQTFEFGPLILHNLVSDFIVGNMKKVSIQIGPGSLIL